MKILSLQFKNLNSLYGEWKIDFTNNTYQQNGLFVLSGPTGAGKTTILDAICLALYGQTPRIGKITKNNNEVMSKNTGECFSEIIFEVKNTSYVSRFEQRRAKNSREGNLQEAKHYVSELKTKKILSEKRTESYQEIVKITGMDFSRFTRSILLAQGAFDSFLKADNEIKSTLLEQITGTEIYSKISKAVFFKCKEEKQKKEALETVLHNTQFLSKEEEENLKQTKNELEKKQSIINTTLQEINQQITWLECIKTLENELQQHSIKKEQLLQEQINKKEQKQKIIKADKADLIRAEYELLTTKEKEYQKIKDEIKNIEKILPYQEQELNLLTQEIATKQITLKEQKEFYQNQEPLYQKTLILDSILEKQEKEYHLLTESIINEQNALKKSQELFQNEEKTLLQIKNEYENLSTWLEQNKAIATLNEKYSKIEQTFSLWQVTFKKGITIKTEIIAHENKKNSFEKELKNEKQKHLSLQKNFETILKEIQEKKQSYHNLLENKLIREFENDLKNLREKKGLVERILSLEEHRKNLQDNTPCPLCGALHHPFAEGNIPSLSEIDHQINSLEEKINSIKKFEQELTQLQLKHTELNGTINGCIISITEKEKNILTIQQEIEKKQIERQNLLNEYTAIKNTLLSELTPYNITEITHENTSLLEELQNLLLLWKKNEEKKNTILETINKKQTELTILKNQQIEKEKIILEKEKKQKEQKENIITNQKERNELFGTKNPEQEKLTLQKTLQQLEKQTEVEKQKHTSLTNNLTKNKEQYNAKQDLLFSIKKELDQNTENFNIALLKNGFLSKEEYLQSILPAEEKEKIKYFFLELEKNISLSLEKEQELISKLQKEKNKQLTTLSLEIITKQALEKQEEQQKLFLEIGSIEERFHQNNINLQKNSQTKQELENLQTQLHQWELLDKLIGSSDGKKFRTFAQGITFEQVIYFANQKLKQLQKRYLLIRDTNEPLSLNVLDDYQGGEIRSVQTLSGGESFIVSLSLALGLAQMASNTISVDSLFLDEGFGTLDEESLEMALSTLANIQQQGKLIGIISHIPLLKERIPTQINIIPKSGGKSIIEGAGCEKIA